MSRTLDEINAEIQKLEEQKSQVENEMREKATLKAEMERKAEADKELDFFKGKKEKDFTFIDPANVMAMGKVQNIEENGKDLHLLLDFERDNSDLKIHQDLFPSSIAEERVITVYKGKEKWGRYSGHYYKMATEVQVALQLDYLQFYVQKTKDSPILMASGELGFVLAPRVENDE